MPRNFEPIRTLTAICPTWRRPALLPNVLAMFRSQTGLPHDLTVALLILDDANQHPPQSGPAWELIPRPLRFRTLGDKFNALCHLAARRGADAVAVWEDDDVYLPHHLAASVAALQHADLAQPSYCYANDREGPRSQHRVAAAGRHHGAWSFRLSAWEAAGRYPRETNGFDFAFQSRMKAAGATIADTLSDQFPAPSYVYRWGTTGYRNASSHGADADWLAAALNDHADAAPRGQIVPQLDNETEHYYRTLRTLAPDAFSVND